MKRFYSIALLAAALALSLGVASFACDPKCPVKAASKDCAHGDPHRAAVQKAFGVLEADLALMQKGVPAADEAAFLKTHQANLKALFDARSACMKNCKAEAASADKKGCKHHQAQQETFKALETDLAQMEKGVPAAEQAAFMKAHQEHLAKLVATHNECLKECKGHGAPKTDKA